MNNMASPPSFLVEDVSKRKRLVDEDKLSRAKELAAEARDIELNNKNLEEMISQNKKRLNTILQSELPDLMSAAGVDDFTLKAHGNEPARKFKLKPYYSANIAVSWSDTKKEKAFAALFEHEGGSLISSNLTVTFPKGERDRAKQLAERIKKLDSKGNVTVTVAESVHHGALGSWLKERCQKGLSIPDLEVIGGRIGQIVKVEELD